MDLYIQIIVVACLTGMTSLLAHRSAAVFHDGIRPILPQLIEGYMNRREAGSIAFGLSIGFVASVGISFTLKTGLLNAWLLFLPTDILGVLAINSLMAFGLGAIWGVLILTCLLPVNQLLTALPVDVLGSLGELSSPVVSAFALFPLVAIFYQFGWKQSLIAAVVVLMTRVVVVRYFPHLNPESIEIFIGMVMLLGIAITHDLRHRDENDIDASGLSVFEERTSRIIKNLPYIAIVGALIAAVASMKIFAGRIYARTGVCAVDCHHRVSNGCVCSCGLYLCLCGGLSLAESDGCSGIRRSGYFGGSLAASFDRQMAGTLPVGA